MNDQKNSSTNFMANLISVVMSTYNEAPLDLRAAIESILKQTHKNIEFIIVLDNPNNLKIKNILEEYEQNDSRINLIHNSSNIGLTNSLNKAVKLASGEFIARMDADDISFNTRLEKQLKYLIKNDLDLLATYKIDIDEHNKVISQQPLFKMNHEDVVKILPANCFITHPSVVFKKETFEKMNGYRDIPSAEDYDLWLRMLKSGYKFGVLDEYLIYYRIRMNSISRSDLYKQFLTSKFLKISYSTDSLESDNILERLERYLEKNKCFNKEYNQKFNKSYWLINESLVEIKRKNIAKGANLLIRAIFTNSKTPVYLYDALRYKTLLNHGIKKRR